jgi:SAM-dependent methyltransferase
MKRSVWDTEYSSGKWVHCENTAGDPIYGYIERYCRKGRLLDLGCGSGNTSNELKFDSYAAYTGVDISHSALDKARLRSASNGRAEKNTYVQSDVLSFEPPDKYDVILFRDSINSLPWMKIRPTLNWYASYLTEQGVFIVRVSGDASRNYKEIAALIEANFDMVEKHSMSASSGTVILVFRSRSTRA